MDADRGHVTHRHRKLVGADRRPQDVDHGLGQLDPADGDPLRPEGAPMRPVPMASSRAAPSASAARASTVGSTTSWAKASACLVVGLSAGPGVLDGAWLPREGGPGAVNDAGPGRTQPASAWIV